MKGLFVTPNEFDLPTDSASIQAAVNEAVKRGSRKVVIPRLNERTGEERWVIDTTVNLPSDIEIVLDNCFMQMADKVVGGFFRTETIFTEASRTKEGRLHGIHIRGIGSATLDGGNPTGLGEKTQDEFGMPVRLNTPIFFMNLEDFSVTNLRITNHRYWGMRFQYCSRGVIRDVYFDGMCDSKNQDGINLRNGCSQILIENIYGQSGDDMIALSAIDRGGPHIFSKNYPVFVADFDQDIHDVTIRNISGAAIHHPLIAMRNHNGNKIYNITIDNVRDTPQLRYAIGEERFNYERYAVVTIGSPNYFETENRMGDTYNISVSNVYAQYSAKAIYLACSLRDATFRNIFATGLCRHVMSVIQTEGWDMRFAGIKLQNVLLDGFVHRPDDSKDTSTLDFSIMRDEDYVKSFRVRNAYIENVECFAEVASNVFDNVKIDRDESAEGLDIVSSSKTRVWSVTNP